MTGKGDTLGTIMNSPWIALKVAQQGQGDKGLSSASRGRDGTFAQVLRAA